MKKSYVMACLLGSFGLLSLPVLGESKPSAPIQALELVGQMETAFNYVAAKARPAVVVITNIQYSQGNRMMPQDFDLPFFFNPYQNQRGRSRNFHRRSLTPANSGSGALVTAEGHVITNFHVIDDCEYLRVKLADGTVYDNQKDPEAVKIVGVDRESDLAVIRLGGGKKTDFAHLDFADADKVKVGQWAIAIGAPHGLEQSVTIGTVSQIGRHNMGVTTFDNYIQTDASLNPGNSGGPLLNIHGEIIGINQFIQTDGMGKGNIGLGFAIASDLAEQVSKALIKDGVVNRPFIGIAMQNLTPELKKQFNVEAGVIVVEVLRGEASEKAGMKAGDIVVGVNGKKIKDSHDLLVSIMNYKPGDNIILQVQREEKTLDLKVIAGKRDLVSNTFKGQQSSDPKETSNAYDKLGLLLENADENVVIVGIDADGAAAEASSRMVNGLRVGDVILEVNRQPVANVQDVKAALKRTRNHAVVLLIERKIRGRAPWRMFVVVPLE